MVSTFEELGGEILYLRRLAEKDNKLWSAFNPSIGVSDSGLYAVAFRSSNYVILPHGELGVTEGDEIQNRVWFAELSDEFTLENMRRIDFSRCGLELRRGVEDPKLLFRDGKWLFTAVAMEKKTIPVARNCICYLDKNAEYVTKVEILPGYETKRAEKNWMTAYKAPKKFDYVYDGNGIVKDGLLIHRLNDDEKTSALRGNAHLVELKDGCYLGVMHTLRVTRRGMKYMPERFTSLENVQKDYRHRFVKFNDEGWATHVSDEFRFVSEGIEFAAGIVEKDDKYVISFGKDDLSSHLAIIDKSIVLSMMKSID